MGRRALVVIAFVLLVSFAGAAPAVADDDNGLALTPPMGWNSWSSYQCAISAQLVEQSASAMVSNGMKAAGYTYVNIDDCWLARTRDAQGNLVADPIKFPAGIKPVADYVHSLGLKLGIYEDAGTRTCAGYPGSYGYEAQDAATFASWGVDYLKYDQCSVPFGDFPGASRQQVYQTLYTRMSDALEATGRPIVFSMCNAVDPAAYPWLWGKPVSNMWRTAGDNVDSYGAMLTNFQSNVGLYRYSGPGGWNDPDLLQIGNGGSTPREYRTELSLWAEMGAPLIAGTNLSALTPDNLAIYENRAVIAVDQDRLGQQGVPLSSAGGLWVLSKQLSAGDRSVLLFNSANTAAPIATTAAATGLPRAPGYRLRNLWSDRITETSGKIAAFVPAHGVVMYRVTPLPTRRLRGLPPDTELTLTSTPQLADGQSSTVTESFANNGASPVEHVTLKFEAPLGWTVTALRRPAVRHLAGGHTFSVRFRLVSPGMSPPMTVVGLTGGVSYETARGHRESSVTLGQLLAFPIGSPYATANTTGGPATFGGYGSAFSINASGTGVAPPASSGWPQPASDSFAAVYAPGGAGPTSTAQVTVNADSGSGRAGGAGLIERDSIATPGVSPGGVVLYVSTSYNVVMAWSAGGGAVVDRSYTLPAVAATVRPTLRLVRSGNRYTGYYSSNEGATWTQVASVVVGAAGGRQDAGVFHASGSNLFSTRADFTDFSVS